jgi:small-conductance mechanosensitive channel
MSDFIHTWGIYLFPLIYPAAAVAAGLVIAAAGMRTAVYLIGRRDRNLGVLFRKRVGSAVRTLLPLLLMSLVFPFLALPERFGGPLRHLLGILTIIGFSWLFIRAVIFLEDLIGLRYTIDVRDNLEARKIHTQTRFFRQVVTAVVVVIALAAVLMTFDRIRQLGTAILASAGLVGVVAGFAAQKSLSTLFAGLQIAITQPIRLDDVVIVEGEWGRIEEITLTYVVVKVWDLRRVVLPITYFCDRPFQNWTRVSADLLGTVFLYTDYTLPVEEVRSALGAILDGSEKWDRKVWNLQVTDCREGTLELRAMMSAADAGVLWDLRCEVREKLVRFIQSKHPGCLPKTRAELTDTRRPGPDLEKSGDV